MNPDRAYLHLRKSRHLGDPDDPALLQSHRAILLRLAEADGIAIAAAHIVTEVESGEFLAHRPDFLAWLEMVERLPAGLGGVLYCMSLDRLSRGDEVERGRVRRALRQAAILIRTPAGWIDLTDPDQSLLAGVRSELAQHELARYKVRIMQARAEKLRRGEVLCGGAPFGYQWDKNLGRPVPIPAEFGVLQRCCQEILTVSVERLAARYGIAPSVLQRALHNPTICGWSARRHGAGVSHTGRPAMTLLPRRSWVWAERPGAWEAACTREEWEAIQAALTRRRNKPEWTRADDSWCRDIVRFVGAPPGAWIRMQTGGRVPAYAAMDPATRKRFAYVGREWVHQVVTAALLPLLAQAAPLAQALSALEERQRQALRPPDETEQTRALLEEKTAQLDGAVRQALSTQSQEIRASLHRAQRELETEIRALRRRLQSPALAPAPPPLAPLLAELAAFADDLPDAWTEAPGALRRRLAAALIDHLPVRVTREAGRRPQREILPVVWQEWVRPLVEVGEGGEGDSGS